MAKNKESGVAQQMEPHPSAVHNMAHANQVRCVAPHFTNGLYTLHLRNGGYYPSVTGSEAMRILQDLQDGKR
jgi:hypothetical protein